MEVLKGSVEEAKKALRSVPTQKLKDEVFWTTAMTESEIEKFVVYIYGKVKKSVRVIPPALGMPIVSSLLPEILKAIDRGVKVKLPISPRDMSLVPVFFIAGRGSLRQSEKRRGNQACPELFFLFRGH
jgi:sugar-specific transcriptional regulator TrmB